MIKNQRIMDEFEKYGGVLKTSELKDLGLSSRQINKMLEDGDLIKIKHGYYELANEVIPEEVILARLFPEAVIFLESALLHYHYTDRIPTSWQIAVNRNSEKSKYVIDYPPVEPYYQEPKFLSIGVTSFEVYGVQVRIFDRDRTMCDLMRYEKKLEKEVFTNAVMRYMKDPKKNVRKLFEYAKIFNISKKVQSQIGKWL